MKSNIYKMHLIAFVDVHFTFIPTYNVEFNGYSHIFLNFSDCYRYTATASWGCTK